MHPMHINWTSNYAHTHWINMRHLVYAVLPDFLKLRMIVSHGTEEGEGPGQQLMSL